MADSFIQVPPNVTGGNKVESDLVGDIHTPKHIVKSGNITVDNFPATQGVIGTVTDGATPSNASILLVGGVTAGGVAQTFETNASGHLNISDGGGSITIDAVSLPLPTGAASETTLAALSDKITNTPSGALLIGTASDRFFDNFADFDTVNTWEVVQTGSGMTITAPLGGAAAGSSPYMMISSGTNINQKTIILSRSTFTAPVDLRYQITASQRIANNRMIIGFVQVDDSGAIVTSTTITTAPDVLNARNAVVHQHDGTTATTSQLRVRAAGSALDTFANAFGTGFTTVATGTTPNFLSATTYALTMERDKILSRALGQNVLTNTGGQFTYDRILVNPTVKYKLCIIVENLGTAPASSTDWRLHLVNVMDATRVDVSPRNSGSTDLSKAFPVVGSVAITSQSALIAGSSLVGDVGQQYRAAATGAASTAKLISAASTNPTVVKASAGKLIGWQLQNTTAAILYVKMHNIATTPTAGSTAVLFPIAIPANGKSEIVLEGGVAFATGISFTTVTGAADADATSVGANAIVGSLHFA